MASPPTTLTVQTEAQLAALLDVRYGGHLLAQFRDGATASEAARRLGEPAPRVSYHVRRLEALGLLVPCGGPPGPGGGRKLRPAAECFALHPDLRGLLHGDSVRPFLSTLTNAFLASAREHPADPGDRGVFLDLRRHAPGEVTLPPLPPHAPRALVRMVSLTPAAFERVCAQAWEALASEAEADPDAPGARSFTLSLLGFPGTMLPLSEAPAERPTHAQ